MERKLHSILVTGGCGFIGANFIHHLFGKSASNNPLFCSCKFDGIVVNLDKLTYAANPKNLEPIDNTFGSGCNKKSQRYFLEQGDICDSNKVTEILKKYSIDTIVNFAAESHVDNSISGPENFITTNINGTFTLLECARQFWTNADGTIRQDVLFHQVSTDEVFGSLEIGQCSTETSPYAPRSPYSASKAAADHLVLSYKTTYGLPVTLSNCSNNYGPFQHREKFIPLMVTNMLTKKPLPVYGDGKNVRDWIYVEDHCSAIWKIISESPAGQRFNVGGQNQWQNITLLKKLIDITQKLSGTKTQELEKLLTFVKDRPGHDRCYSLDCTKIQNELGWSQAADFDQSLEATVRWYMERN